MEGWRFLPYLFAYPSRRAVDIVVVFSILFVSALQRLFLLLLLQ